MRIYIHQFVMSGNKSAFSHCKISLPLGNCSHWLPLSLRYLCVCVLASPQKVPKEEMYVHL